MIRSRGGSDGVEGVGEDRGGFDFEERAAGGLGSEGCDCGVEGGDYGGVAPFDYGCFVGAAHGEDVVV